jgi:glycerophosphoryl diester phosphodiesterase
LSTFLTRNKVIKSLPQQKSSVILKIRPNLILDAVHEQTRSSRTTTKHQKRPFFIIAHMCNSIKTAKKYLNRGPNAIESDVTFLTNGSVVLYHGYLCHCLRYCSDTQKLSEFLEFIRNITTPGLENYNKDLVLLFLDIKSSKISNYEKQYSGQKLAALIVKHLFNENPIGSKIKVLISIENVSDLDFLIGFKDQFKSQDLNHLNELIGWDIGPNNDLSDIEDTNIRRIIKTLDNLWEGDGLTNCLSPFHSGRLESLIKKRDEQSFETNVKKVYHWTIDLSQYLRESLRLGVDGIITNHPERLLEVLKEEEFADKYRIANQSDNPWERVLTYTNGQTSHHSSISSFVEFTELLSSVTLFLEDFVCFMKD